MLLHGSVSLYFIVHSDLRQKNWFWFHTFAVKDIFGALALTTAPTEVRRYVLAVFTREPGDGKTTRFR